MPDFLYDAGVSGASGFVVAPFDLMSTELNAVGSGQIAISSVGGQSGLFTQPNFSSCVWAHLWFKPGGAITPLQGGVLSLWWLLSPDNGATIEPTAFAPGRNPDAIIAPAITAYSAGQYMVATKVLLPPYASKVMLRNDLGVVLPASGNHLTVGPFAERY